MRANDAELTPLAASFAVAVAVIIAAVAIADRYFSSSAVAAALSGVYSYGVLVALAVNCADRRLHNARRLRLFGARLAHADASDPVLLILSRPCLRRGAFRGSKTLAFAPWCSVIGADGAILLAFAPLRVAVLFFSYPEHHFVSHWSLIPQPCFRSSASASALAQPASSSWAWRMAPTPPSSSGSGAALPDLLTRHR
jgi:hypothetical protein